MVRQFMVEEQPVPMSWIFSTRRYGLKIRYTTTASGRIHWDGDTIGYQNVKFSMGQFRAWVHGLVGECQSILEKDLLMINEDIGGGEELPQIPWSALGDNPSENRPGYHLVNHNESQLPVDGHSWLFHRIVGNPQRAQEFLSDGKEWRAARIKSYLRSLRRFKEKMLVLMHICGGQPAGRQSFLASGIATLIPVVAVTSFWRLAKWASLQPTTKATHLKVVAKSFTGICLKKLGHCWFTTCGWFDHSRNKSKLATLAADGFPRFSPQCSR